MHAAVALLSSNRPKVLFLFKDSDQFATKLLAVMQATNVLALHLKSADRYCLQADP